MVIVGSLRIVLNRFQTRKDGKRANYPLNMWVEVVDYARVGGWEYIATDQNVVFKRIYTVHNTTEGWLPCPELCVVNRGSGYLFNQTISLLHKEKDDAHV